MGILDLFRVLAYLLYPLILDDGPGRVLHTRFLLT
jgi:hypothetical protein